MFWDGQPKGKTSIAKIKKTLLEITELRPNQNNVQVVENEGIEERDDEPEDPDNNEQGITIEHSDEHTQRRSTFEIADKRYATTTASCIRNIINLSQTSPNLLM